jgi:hypothetical protein
MMEIAALAFFIILLGVSALIGIFLTKKEKERIAEAADSLRSSNRSELES